MVQRIEHVRAPVQPARVTAEQVTDAVLRGSWVVDLRDASAYAAAHLPGSVNVAYSPQFATYVGWLVPWDDDIVLLTDRPEVLESALRDLAGIGIDGVDLHLLDATSELPSTLRRSDWTGFAAAIGRSSPVSRVVIDVRRLDEHEAGHLPGAVHVALHDVELAAPTLPPGELWVHCRSGHRAGMAASLLHRMGRSVVHVDDAWERVAELGLPLRGELAA